MLGIITYTLILVSLLVGTWRRPAIGFAAVLCLYGLKQWGQSSTALLSEYRQVTNFAIAAIALLGVGLNASRGACLFCRTAPATLLIGALYLYAFITISWAPDWQTSLNQWVSSAPYLVTVTLLAPLLMNDLDDARKASIATLLAGGSLCALALLFGHWGDRGLILFGHEAMEDVNSIYRFETNPLALSSLGGTVFLISALSLGRPNPLLLRLIAAACIPITLAVVLRSGSRGQLIASGLAMGVALPIAYRLRDGRSWVMLVLLVALILGLGWWSTSLVNIDVARWSDSRTTDDVAGRFAMAQALWNAATSNFFTIIFGIGNSSAFKILGIYPHITALEVLAEEGLIGGLMYFGAIFLTMRSIWRIVARTELSATNRNALAIFSGLFVFELIVSWKQGTLLFSVNVFAFAIALARLEMAGASSTTRRSLVTIAAESGLFPNLLR